MELRSYQQRALDAVHVDWATGVKRVVLVMPTGSGKTFTGSVPVRDALEKGQRVVWLAHRRELIAQAAQTLVALGIRDIGMISPHHHADRWAKVQVASIDTLIARGWRPQADLIVYDECHRARGPQRMALVQAYPEARVLGLTATPQRGDKKALGDVFETLVVGARYSELLELNKSHPDQGIVSCRVFRPDKYLGSDGLAKEPLDAWLDLKRAGLDGPCFLFCKSVEDAKQRVREFRMAGESVALVTGQQGNAERAKGLDDFKAGRVRILASVQALCEGTDVPSAATALLAANCSSAGAMLQKVGRVLRPAPGKSFAVCVDLIGMTLDDVYGLPTADRVYSLTGRAIAVEGAPLKCCPKCGSTIPAGMPMCDGFMPDGSACGYVFEKRPHRLAKIYNLELQEAVDRAGGDIRLVSREAKINEAVALLRMARTNGYDILWAIQRWRKTFDADGFPTRLLSADERRAIFAKFVAQGKAAGWKPIAARVKYKALLGEWPS